MKITAVRGIPLYGRIPDAGWEAEVENEETLHTLIEITTDEGITGYGSSYTSQSFVESALRLLRPWLIGEAIEPERVTETLHQRTFWLGRGGNVTQTISGIDIALWDIFGKLTGQPIGRLLGGCYRDRIKPYGSLLFDDPPRLRDKLQEAVGRGFRAIKLGWGDFGRVNRQTDEAMMRAARDAVGDGVELMVDAGASEQFWAQSYKWALETAKMLVDYDVTWFEEALPPDDIENFIRLREHAPLPISSGEVLTRRQSFIPWLERGAVDIIQPDCTKVGGLSEARRIGWMAHDHGVLLVPHGWNTAVGLAADLQLVSALPVAKYVEYITPSPFIEDLVTQPFQLDADGMLSIPTAPGLGIELNMDAIRYFSREK